VANGVSQRWFVTVSDLDAYRWLSADAAFGDLQATMGAATALAADAALDFVVAPIPAVSGGAVIRMHPRYALNVFPVVDGTPGQFRDGISADERTALTGLLAALHGATPTVPAAPVREPALAGRAVLATAISESGGLWQGGPFTERARALIAAHSSALRSALSAFDELVSEVAGSGRTPVITHGEPHPGNMIWVGRRILLIDWDTAGLAQPERDLWMLASGTGEELRYYTQLTGREVSEAALRLYRLRWDLEDITLFLQEFRAPHRYTPDTETSWRGFSSEVERLVTEHS
jgi:spectinomycin phosphotransferase